MTYLLVVMWWLETARHSTYCYGLCECMQLRLHAMSCERFACFSMNYSYVYCITATLELRKRSAVSLPLGPLIKTHFSIELPKTQLADSDINSRDWGENNVL